MSTATTGLHTLIYWQFTDPDGRRVDTPVYGDAILLEVLREYEIADADPDFVELTIDFCQVRPPLPYRARIRRVAFSEDTMTFLGYRQPDGSYSTEERAGWRS